MNIPENWSRAPQPMLLMHILMVYIFVIVCMEFFTSYTHSSSVYVLISVFFSLFPEYTPRKYIDNIAFLRIIGRFIAVPFLLYGIFLWISTQF